MTARRPAMTSRRFARATRPARRGNTLVLVTAILVLLVIIATAFISRTQAGRQVSAAQQAAAGRDDRASAIAEDLAGMLGDALFPQPVDPNAIAGGLGAGYRQDPNDPTIRTVVTSWPRLATPANARVFQVDRNFSDPRYPDFAYNAPAYATIPWTNWPDFLSDLFPAGPGQPTGAFTTSGGGPIGDANPYGNPGFNDNRWLRSTEPVRVDTNGDGIPDTFTHWAHLSWIATANNGYRVVKDISDIAGTALVNMNEANFTQPWAVGLPYEQWLPNVPPAGIANAGQFISLRDAWFGALNGGNSYITNYQTGAALPNFFRLADLKASASDPPNPADEFRFGTLRNVISRTLADTDGDGFTDAFWFLAPTPIDRSIRTLVAVSVVDNSGLVNANVATRFNPHNSIGATPADIAQIGNPVTTGEQVGFLDYPGNSAFQTGLADPTMWTATDGYPPVSVGYTRNRFGDGTMDSLTYLQQVGMKDASGNVNPNMADTSYPAKEQADFYSAAERMLFFKSMGLRLEEPNYALTPFSVGDELELRAYHGSNNPWVLSRFERSLNTQFNANAFLRSSPDREENSEYLDRLTARQLLLDNRRKLTLFNGVRNDRLPPWLWPSPYPDPSIDYNRDGQVSDTDGNPATLENPAAAAADYAAFQRQTLRFDLRRAMDDPLAGSSAVLPAGTVEENRRNWRVDLQQLLERTLSRSWTLAAGGTHYESYLGSPTNQSAQYQRAQYDKTRQMAASMTANIDQYRDRPTVLGTAPNIIVQDPPLHPALGVQDPIKNDWRYIGQEKQPFIVEAFFALVYPKSNTNLPPSVPGQTNPYQIPLVFQGGGEHFVDSSTKPSVVVAVQIANPYDTPINLADFRLRFYGKSYAFATGTYGPTVVLGPATDRGPTTAIVYAIKDAPGGDTPPATFPFVGTWLDFMDIEATELYNPAADLNAQTKVFDASSSWLGSVTVNSPAVDPNNSLNDENADSIELLRVIGPQAGPGAGQPSTVVVDRFDNRVSGPKLKFAEAMSRLFTDPQYYPPHQGYEYDPANPPDRNWMNGLRIGSDDYFVAWIRASRPWRWDVWGIGLQNGDGVITPDEINPRYVFSMGSKPTLPTNTQSGSVSGADQNFKGDRYKFDQDADGTNLWITYTYRNLLGQERRGKPTFFTNAVRQDPGSQNNVYGLGFPYPDANGVFPANVVVGDKGLQVDDWVDVNKFTAMRSPFQLLEKGSDFDQVGELLNVLCWGPVIDISTGFATPKTEKTLSEILLQEDDNTDQPAGRGIYVNRLRITPWRDSTTDGSAPTDGPTTVLGSPPNAPYVPALPAGAAIFDALVCDDRGAAKLDLDLVGQPGYGTIEPDELLAAERRRPRNAASYMGTITPGLLNINTAMWETMRTLPNMTRLVNNDADFAAGSGTGLVDQLLINPVNNPFSRIIDSLLLYRDRVTRQLSGAVLPGVPNPNLIPAYVDRGLAQNAIPGTNGFMGPITAGGTTTQPLRGARGVESIGELLLLQRYLDDPSLDLWNVERSFSIEFDGMDPYRTSEANPGASGIAYANQIANRLSVDVTQGRNTASPDQTVPPPMMIPDRVGGDAEDRNILFSGLSNLITTRSDVFTVYFRVRSVRQDPVTGKWDGTRPEMIVDDSRYVMIVDRSNVNTPGDRPKVLAVRKLPN